MVSISGCAKANEVDLVGRLSPIIRVRDEEDIVAELEEWPRLKGARVEYPMGCSRFWEFCKAKSSVDGIWGHTFGYRAQFDYGLALLLSNLAKSVMNMIGACPAQLNFNFWEVILVYKILNERWATSDSVSRITAKDFLEYYAVKYVIETDGAYLSPSSSRPCFFDLSSAERVWNGNLQWVSGECLQQSDKELLELNNRTITKGISCKVAWKESFIDSFAKEGNELEAIFKKLGINRFKRVASKEDKVRRSQAKRRMAGKTLGSMKENMLTLELNTPLKLARLNEMPDGPVDMATVSSTVVQNLAKRKAVKSGAASRSATSDSVDDGKESVKIAEGVDLRPRFVAETGLMEEQCRAKAREKGVNVVEDEFRKFVRSLSWVQLGLQDRSIELERRISQLEGEKIQFEESLTREREAFQLELEKEREGAALKLKEVRAESVAEAERLVSASATSRNNLVGKLYQLRYTKAEILAFSEGNYEEKEIVDEEENEEMEDSLNVAEMTIIDNQETIDQEIESLRLRVVDLEGLLEVEKNSSANLQKELDVAREREEQTLLYNAEHAEEYEALISQYEDRLDDNVNFSLKLEEAKSQVEDKIATLLSKDLALNQLISKLAELKEREASVVKERVSEVDLEKLSSSIVGKDLELRNSTQVLDSLITRLDHLKADLRHFKEREAKSRVDLAEVQAKNKNLVDDLAYARRNVRRAVQRDMEMNERINQLCARITELERELRVWEMKYKKDLKLELDKRDGEIASGEGSREMKEFLRQKEELVENMRIDLTNSCQKSIDLTRQMSERID
ncbi:hypothetical protein GIB67_001492 [Kingdonia uniflora]|uniref:Uncharacterized protein n=1 Tax=Kingdonia uniflora TaxID=39325 RepID=A0A7J7MNC9_9MAGN|nr:hypothetical protein GIB67_001492 [Kingdonia uniflora]